MSVSYKLLISLLVLILASSLVLRLIAIAKLPPIGDEPDDYPILLELIKSPTVFFYNVHEPDQARLPHLISIPLVLLFEKGSSWYQQQGSLIPTRILFLGIHMLFLFFCYLLAKELFQNKASPVWYVTLLVSSAYLASFSIFTMTTSNSLFLFFFIVSLYIYYKNLKAKNKSNVFQNYILFAVSLGLLIASRLTGVLFLVIFCIFHVFRRKTWNVRLKSRKPTLFAMTNLIFFLTVFGISISTVFLPDQKTGILFFMGACYVIYLLTNLAKEHTASEAVRVNKLVFWAGIFLTVLNVTLFFSPIYLNFDNVFQIFAWYPTWNTGEVVSRSNSYDFAVILLIKYGTISALLLLIPLWIFIKSKLYKKTNEFFYLSLLICIAYTLVLAVIKFRVAWYWLPVFPFLYLPFIWMFDYATSKKLKNLTVFSVFLLILVIADNSYRYIKWFPYGHWDGAEYGNQLIGWDKPGLITYEAGPLIYSYFSQSPNFKTGTFPIEVEVRMTTVNVYNNWVADLLNDYFTLVKKEKRFVFIPSEATLRPSAMYLLSSPIYNNQFEAQLAKTKNYKVVKTISIKRINIISIWQRN